MRGYGRRYVGDIRAFIKAYLLSLLAVLPLVLQFFSIYGVFVYVFLLLAGAINLGLFGGLTAISENYAYKFLIYLIAVAANAFALHESFTVQVVGAPNVNLLLFAQIVFPFMLFYALMERGRIGTQLRNYLDSES
jgi:hypothetical protein